MIKINLNKKQKTIKMETGGLLAYLISSVVVAVVVVLFFHFSIKAKISHVNKNIKIYNGKITLLMPKVQAVRAVIKENTDITQKINTINSLKKEQMGPIGYIYNITKVIPKFSWINSLKSNNGNIVIDGVALDGQVVSIFMDNLNGAGFFNNVSLVQTTEIKKEGLRLQNFSLTMNVNKNASLKKNNKINK